MVRILLTWLLPLLAPSLIYIAIMFLRGRTEPGWIRRGPWVWLVTGGLALMLLSLGAWALTGGRAPGDLYVPSRFEDGQLRPSGTVDAEERGDGTPATPN